MVGVDPLLEKVNACRREVLCGENSLLALSYTPYLCVCTLLEEGDHVVQVNSLLEVLLEVGDSYALVGVFLRVNTHVEVDHGVEEGSSLLVGDLWEDLLVTYLLDPCIWVNALCVKVGDLHTHYLFYHMI